MQFSLIWKLVAYHICKYIDKIEMYSIIGKKVLIKNDLNRTSKIDVSNLSKGVYLLKAYIDGAVGTKKFIKQ